MADTQRTPSTIGQLVSEVMDAMREPVERRAGMSQGELWGEFFKGALMQAPMAMGRAPMPNTAGVGMPAGASSLPPASMNTRRGYGATPDMAAPANRNARAPMGPPRTQPLSGDKVMLYRRLVEQGIPEAEAMHWARNWQW